MKKKKQKVCGTINYIAPEILREDEYNEKIDGFSLGVLIYFMVRGYLPFDANDSETVVQYTLHH